MIGVGVNIWTTTILAGGWSAPDSYALNGSSMDYVLDFENNYARVGGSSTTLADAVTYGGGGLRTCYNAAGELCWNAHNLALHSEDFSNAIWSKIKGGTGVDPVITANSGEAPDGTMTADQIVFDKGESDTTSDLSGLQQTASGVVGTNNTRGLWLRTTSGTCSIALRASTYTICNVTTEWQFFEHTDTTPLFQIILRGTYGTSNTCTVLAWGAQQTISDLPMLDNPDGTGTYVLTTSSAVYKWRANGYLYSDGELQGPKLIWDSEAATNLDPNSNDLTSKAIVGGDSLTLTPGAAIGPDGGNSLTRLEITDTTNEIKSVAFNLSVTSESTYCSSCFFKNDDQRYVSLKHYRSENNWTVAVFDLSNGTVVDTYTGASGGEVVLVGIDNVGGDIYRAYLSSAEVGTTLSCRIDFIESDSPSFNTNGNHFYSGTAGVGLYAGFCQTELGSSPTSYIPTNGSTATRAAETATIAAADLPYSATAMSITMRGNMTYADNNSAAEVGPLDWRLDANNRITWEVSTASANTGRPVLLQRVSSVFDTSSGVSDEYSPSVNTPFSISSRHGSGFIQGASKGDEFTADTTPTALPDLSSTDMDLLPTFHGGIDLFMMCDEDIGEDGIIEGSALPDAPLDDAPILSGNNLWDQYLIDGDGDGTIDASEAFEGDNIVYTATYEAGSLPAGWSINSSTGVISYDDDVLSEGTIEVTATNSGGSETADFTVEVLSAAGAETVTGDQGWTQYVSNGDDYPVIDLTGATWNSDNDSTPSELEYPVRVRNYTAATVIRNGYVDGMFHAGMEWSDVYAQGNSVALFSQDNAGARTLITGFSATNIFDGVRLTSSDNTTINNVWIRGARDDAIELEKAGDDVLVKDSLFEYCFSGISISEDQTAVAGHTFTFENVLVHMSRYLYGSDVTHGNPIKGGDPDPVEVNPDLVMNNCVLAITDVNHLNTRFEHAMGAITSGSNNLLLNLTDDALPGGYPTLHESFTTLNGSAARAKWLERRAAFFTGNPVHSDVEDDRISFIVGVPSGGAVYHGFSDGNSSGNGAGYTFGTPMDMAIDGTTVSYLTVTTGGLLRIGFAGQVQISGVTDVEVTLPGLEEGPVTCTWNGTWYEAAGPVAARNTYMENEDGNYLTVRVVKL